MLSDIRAKVGVRPLGWDVIPGVPAVSFAYRHAPLERLVGVIAQDVERVRPELVARRSDGLLAVNYAGLMEAP